MNQFVVSILVLCPNKRCNLFWQSTHGFFVHRHDNDPHWCPPTLNDFQKTVLDEIKTWAKDFNKRPIFFLKGEHWTGNTDIALNALQDIHKSGELVVSFFCTKGSNTGFMLPRLANKLALEFPKFRLNLLQAIEKDPLVADRVEKDYQMDKLILDPLRQSGSPKTVIIIDSLQEYQEKGREILLCLKNTMSKIQTAGIKFLITCDLKKIHENISLLDSESESFALEENISS